MKLLNKVIIILIVSIFYIPINSVYAQKQMENLTRGAIAIREGNGYFVSWRLLGNEPWNTEFNIYRDGVKITENPIQLTSYLDEDASLDSKYVIKAVIDGEEKDDILSARVVNNREGTAGWFDIPLQRPSEGIHGGTYSPNDASVGDLTGNGEYDIVLKWDPSNSKDNSHSGTTDNVILDGYTMDGDHLWRIDLGPNIRAGAHYTQFLVYDFDGDGKAEIMVKTAPGTKDGTGNYISKGPARITDHTIEYRNGSGYILSGPEYLTVFDGETGAELETVDYWPQRGNVGSWGDGYGNRVDRFNATVAYVDGEKPSGVFQRGYYTRLTMAAWDWRDGKLTRKWAFDSNAYGNGLYAGQGNHSIHVIDADGDGKHDIVTGSAVISGDGTGMHTSRMGHGDATHVTYMKKNESRPMIYMPHESGGHGVSLRYADDGEIIFNHRLEGADVGRGAAAELDMERPGFHFWASNGLGLYNMVGNKVGNIPNSVNFLIWWDGDLTRELLNNNRIDKWSIKTNSGRNLLTGNGTTSNNGSKSTPTLSADLFGDWREEVILRRNDNNAVRVYISAIPTEHKLYTLMHDPVYRVAISWQNSSYNQPPHPGFYLASDMDFPQDIPNVELIDRVSRGKGYAVKELELLDLGNATGWSIVKKSANNISVFSDMYFYIPEEFDFLLGKELIKTSTESRRILSNTLAEFKTNFKTDVYIVHQKSIRDTPEWLSDWTLMDESVYIENVNGAKIPMNLFKKEVEEGETVKLGQNTNNGSASNIMYFVIVDSETPSSIEDKVVEEVVIYPNPFRDKTHIDYFVSKHENVNITIYDMNGRMIKVIENSYKTPGKYSVILNSDELVNGVYLIRITAGDSIINQKVIFQK